MVLGGQCHSKVSLFNLALLFRAATGHVTIDLVHGRILRVVLRDKQTLDATIAGELLPVVDILEHVVHCSGNLAARFTDYARVIIFSPPVVENCAEARLVVLNIREPLAVIFVTRLCQIHALISQHNVKDGADEEECADESLCLKLIGLEERHHTDLVADGEKQPSIRRSINELALRVNFFPVDIQ